MGDSEMRVRGHVTVPEELPAGAGKVRVRVEDVSRIDAAAVVVAAADLPIDAPLAPGAAVPFELEVGDVDPRSRYSVRVHVDRNATGNVTPGDLVSTETYPVLTQGASNDVEVRVRPVA